MIAIPSQKRKNRTVIIDPNSPKALERALLRLIVEKLLRQEREAGD